jgi:hypothetical protein
MFMDERDDPVDPYDVLRGRAMDAIEQWARGVHFEPLLDAIDDHAQEDRDERGNAWTYSGDEPEEDDDQLELDLDDRRAA